MKILKSAVFASLFSLFLFSCKTTAVEVTDTASVEAASQQKENADETVVYRHHRRRRIRCAVFPVCLRFHDEVQGAFF